MLRNIILTQLKPLPKSLSFCDQLVFQQFAYQICIRLIRGVWLRLTNGNQFTISFSLFANLVPLMNLLSSSSEENNYKVREYNVCKKKKI